VHLARYPGEERIKYLELKRMLASIDNRDEWFKSLTRLRAPEKAPLKRKAPLRRAFVEPSNGLEPLTPSLP
jgi:hypothetical protein